MLQNLANDFYEILPALFQNSELVDAVLLLIESEPVSGKATEGGNRLSIFRSIMEDLVNGAIGLEESYRRVSRDLPRTTSVHGRDNRVFAKGWEERLVRTQLSVYYNQAVLEILLTEGETDCYVPHSSREKSDSECTRYLAGRNHSIQSLLSKLKSSYGQSTFTRELKVPNHPHCTHVVTRAS